MLQVSKAGGAHRSFMRIANKPITRVKTTAVEIGIVEPRMVAEEE
jgi:hypothetical protein